MSANSLKFGLMVIFVQLEMFSAIQLAAQSPPPPPPAPRQPTASSSPAEQAPAVPAGDAVEVLTRGPIHEAFAQPVESGSVQPIAVPKEPPEPIAEVPPDLRPEGENVVWIAGYWAWDDDRQDFVWVSGVWRVAPPDQQWVAGYWTRDPAGWRWTPGFWTSAKTQEVIYQAEPPASLEQGPTSQPPTAEHFWVPGCWLWREMRYAWRPGYWAPGHRDWVWTPASYYWSPAGWVFSDGYWDFPPVRRGLAFCPVRFVRPVWRAADYFYTPQVAIDLGSLSLHLFARPSYSHYYFGDYYAPRYVDMGIYPWFAVREHRHYAYDPLFTYQHWSHRHDPQWNERLRASYRYYRQHEDQRPAHTLVAQQQMLEKFRNRQDINVRDLVVGTSLQEYRRRPDPSLRLAPIPETQRQQLADMSRQMRQLPTERRQLEAKAAAAVQSPAKPALTGRQPERLRLPRSAEVRVARLPESPADGRDRPGGERPQLSPKPAESSGKPESGPASRPEAKPARPEAKRPPPRPETRPESRPAPRPESKLSEPKTEARPESRPAPRPETKLPPKPETRPESRPAPRPEPKLSEPKPEARPQPRPAPRPETKLLPKPETKPESRPAPRPEPKLSEPKPEARPAPRPTPRPETKLPSPKPEMRLEPRPAPRPEAKLFAPRPETGPRPESRPTPVAPRSESRPNAPERPAVRRELPDRPDPPQKPEPKGQSTRPDRSDVQRGENGRPWRTLVAEDLGGPAAAEPLLLAAETLRPPLSLLAPGIESYPGSVRPGIGRGSTQPVHSEPVTEKMSLPRPQRDVVSPTQPRQPGPAPGWSGDHLNAARPDHRDVELPRRSLAPVPPPTFADTPLRAISLPGPPPVALPGAGRPFSARTATPAPMERETAPPRARPAPPRFSPPSPPPVPARGES